MATYRFTGNAPVLVPALHRELAPGDEFESELEFSGDFEEIESSGPADESAEEV